MVKKTLKSVLFYYALGILLVILAVLLFRNISPTPAYDPNTSQMRIVSLAPNLTEILYGLGLEDYITAVSSDSNYPPRAAEKMKAGSFWQPDAEAIAASQPTLVVCLDFMQQRQLAEKLNRTRCRTLSVQIETIEQLFAAIEQIGNAAGRSAEAAAMKASIENGLNEISRRRIGQEDVKVLWVIQRQPLRAAGTDTFIDEMIRLVGGVNAIGPSLHKYPPLDSETVIASEPDVIIETFNMDQGRKHLRETAATFYAGRFPGIPAVENKKIYVLDSDLVCRLGPRLAEGVELIERCISGEGEAAKEAHAHF